VRELDRVVSDFKFKMRSLDRSDDMDTSAWLLYVLDHKGLLRYTSMAALTSVQTDTMPQSTYTPQTTPAQV
jgi:hypothetical protein